MTCRRVVGERPAALDKADDLPDADRLARLPSRKRYGLSPTE